MVAVSDKQGVLPREKDELFIRLAELIEARYKQASSKLPPEGDLATELGVGRQRLREALSALELVGAISVRKGAGRTWEGFNLGRYADGLLPFLMAGTRTARELLEVRHALETALLPKTAARLSESQLDRLRNLAKGMVLEAENGCSFAHLDRQFHRLLFEPLENDTLNGLLDSFWIIYEGIKSKVQAAAEDPGIAAMHGNIVEAISQGDIQRAVYELDAHFYGVERKLATDEGAS